MFSSRLPKDLSPSPFFSKLEKAKKECKKQNDFIDLTISSPINAGMPFDLQTAIELSKEEFGTWTADSSGREKTREAIAEYYKKRNGNFSSEQIILTSSTSEAYSILFKAFCNPSDTILTPVPGYPLLDTLAQLEHLKCYPYFLKLSFEEKKDLSKKEKIFRFVLDTDSFFSAPESAKILLLVSPHNPTGHCVSEREWNLIIDFCEQRKMILVVDEVFGDYAIDLKVRRSWQYLKNPKCPIFWLNGLSKTVGSPQLKLGWMAFSAPKEQFESIHAAIEFVADAYLSVSAPAQALAPSMLLNSHAYEVNICERITCNWNALKKTFPSKYCPEVLGGWYAAIRLGEDDEELTLQLLQKKHVLVQPGFFFDFEEDGWIVISLMPEPELFCQALARLKME